MVRAELPSSTEGDIRSNGGASTVEGTVIRLERGPIFNIRPLEQLQPAQREQLLPIALQRRKARVFLRRLHDQLDIGELSEQESTISLQKMESLRNALDKTAHLVPSETPRPLLSLRQREVLQHVAMGETNKQIATTIGISVMTVKNHLTNTHESLGAFDGLNALLLALETGELDIEFVTQGYDFARFERVSEREIEVLEELVWDYGRYSENKQIARRLDISDQTVKNHLTSIFAKLEVSSSRNRERVAVLYLRYKELKREEKMHVHSGA